MKIIVKWISIAIISISVVIIVGFLSKKSIINENINLIKIRKIDSLESVIDSLSTLEMKYKFKSDVLQKQCIQFEDSIKYLTIKYEDEINSIRNYTINQLDSAITAAINNYTRKNSKKR